MTETGKKNPFDGPQMQEVQYKRADMTRANFDGVNLMGARFFAVLSKARFTDTNLAEANFDDVNLSGSTFNNINFSGATITNANLSGLSVSGVTLENADIRDANLNGMRINGVLVSDLFEAYEKQSG